LKTPSEPTANAANINTPGYWDGVYRQEWESGSVLSGNYHRDYAPIHDAIIGLIKEGSSVLDIACGAGLLCQKIQKRIPGTQVLGVDFAQYTIEQNRKRDRDLGVEYLCLDIRNSLGSLDRTFDVVMMCEILEHLDEPESTVASALGLLKTGGRFILTCPHDNEIPDPEHVRSWGHDEVFHLLAPYSDTVSFVHFPPPWFHIWMMAYLTKSSPGHQGGTAL
jgi:2-polyprenyl-3-methyl-5-hydroxy-6-metoxy-1,4-benzoquinol methylase